MKTFKFDNKTTRSLTGKEVKKIKLSRKEISDIKSIEKGKYQSLPKKELQNIKAAVKKKAESIRRENSLMISIRVDNKDLAALKKQANSEGLPYQTYIKSQLHKIAMAR